jgi:hypothetical protein
VAQSGSPDIVKILSRQGYGKSTANYSSFLYFGDLCPKITAIKPCLIQYEFSKIPFAQYMLDMVFCHSYTSFTINNTQKTIKCLH